MRADNHTHSHFSSDSESAIADMVRAAAERGFTHMTVTDHFDIDGIRDGIYPPYDPDGQLREILEVRRQFPDGPQVAYGIEIGQPYLMPEESEDMLKNHPFDLVLVSVHNLDKTPDFYLLDYPHMTQEEMEDYYRRYLEDLMRAASFPGAHVLTHCTYPMRYLKAAGRDIDLNRFREAYDALFRLVVRRGLALEINTKKVRKGLPPDPPLELMKWYYEAGGRLLSIGSDAHMPYEMGADLSPVVQALRAIGFREMIVGMPGGPQIRPLGDY